MSLLTLPTTRITVREYERMDRAGMFGHRRVELVAGRIYRMAPQLDPHMMAVSMGTEALLKIRRATDWVVIQGTLRLDRYSAPDPDLMLLPVPLGTPHEEWPSPILLIEISSTTYKRDSVVKLKKYAQSGIADYWIENLKADRIEVYRRPVNPTGKLRDCGYESVTHYGRGEEISLLARPEVMLAVDDLLP